MCNKVLEELNARFSEHDDNNLYTSISSLCPISINFLEKKDIRHLAQTYKTVADNALSSVDVEVAMLVDTLRRGLAVQPKSSVDLLKFLHAHKEIFYYLYNLSKIASVIPVSSASAERSFSAMTRVKNHMRSAMADRRLENLLVIVCNLETLSSVTTEDVLEIFIKNHGNTRIRLI